MASNSFGKHFRITTWGESHGKEIGCVIDGVPPGIEITEDEINSELQRRAPGMSERVSPRKEKDTVEIMSGIFEGKTTGAPLCLVIKNRDHDSSKYEPIKNLHRPGHANFTYLKKYGIFDYRGGGRASSRETVARVAAGAVAKKILDEVHIEVAAYIDQIGPVGLPAMPEKRMLCGLSQQELFCPCPDKRADMLALLDEVKKEGDSVGAVVACRVDSLPAGLGDPIYEKLQALLAGAIMTIPACRGFEIGEGFKAVSMHGSEHNDGFSSHEGITKCTTNHAGGLLGGITTGEPLFFRAAFKPTSSIKKAQKTTDLEANERQFQLPEGSRHDPCVGIRAVPIVEAMTRLVIVDAYFSSKLV